MKKRMVAAAVAAMVAGPAMFTPAAVAFGGEIANVGAPKGAEDDPLRCCYGVHFIPAGALQIDEIPPY